jgi:hypothetical protein
MIEVISLNEFLRREVNCCFVCGGREFLEFEVCGVFYRVCEWCLRKSDVKRFFRQKYDVDIVEFVLGKGH